MLYKGNELTPEFLKDCAEIISLMFVQQNTLNYPVTTIKDIGDDVAKELINDFISNIENKRDHSEKLENLMTTVIELLKKTIESAAAIEVG